MDIYIQHNVNYNYSSTLELFKYEDNHMEIIYYPKNDSIVLLYYNGKDETVFDTKLSSIPFHDYEEWEPWAFQQYTRYDIDFDNLRIVLLELQKLIDYVELYVSTLPSI